MIPCSRRSTDQIKVLRSNMPIREVGCSGERKNPRGRRKKRKKARTERLGAELKHHLSALDPGTKPGAKIYGAKLGARIYGAELSVKLSSRLRRAQDLGASNDGAKKCKLGASNDGAELRVQILKSFLQGHICEFFFKKWLKIKNSANLCP